MKVTRVQTWILPICGLAEREPKISSHAASFTFVGRYARFNEPSGLRQKTAAQSIASAIVRCAKSACHARCFLGARFPSSPGKMSVSGPSFVHPPRERGRGWCFDECCAFPLPGRDAAFATRHSASSQETAPTIRGRERIGKPREKICRSKMKISAFLPNRNFLLRGCVHYR